MAKYRSDFVTNSSSSSFVISKRDLSLEQIDRIRNHRELLYLYCCNTWDEWDIEETEDEIRGFTLMDNFPMYEFLRKIGVNLENVDFCDF